MGHGGDKIKGKLLLSVLLSFGLACSECKYGISCEC